MLIILLTAWSKNGLRCILIHKRILFLFATSYAIFAVPFMIMKLDWISGVFLWKQFLMKRRSFFLRICSRVLHDLTSPIIMFYLRIALKKHLNIKCDPRCGHKTCKICFMQHNILWYSKIINYKLIQTVYTVQRQRTLKMTSYNVSFFKNIWTT